MVIPATASLWGQLVACPLMHHMAGLRAQAQGQEGQGQGAEDSAPYPCPSQPLGQQGDRGGEGGSLSCRVLGALGSLDAGARAAAFAGDELYEVGMGAWGVGGAGAGQD